MSCWWPLPVSLILYIIVYPFLSMVCPSIHQRVSKNIPDFWSINSKLFLLVCFPVLGINQPIPGQKNQKHLFPKGNLSKGPNFGDPGEATLLGHERHKKTWWVTTSSIGRSFPTWPTRNPMYEGWRYLRVIVVYWVCVLQRNSVLVNGGRGFGEFVLLVE